MITKESLAKWAAKNRNALFLMVCVALSQVLLYFTTTAAAERKRNQYKVLYIAGRVDMVMPRDGDGNGCDWLLVKPNLLPQP